MEKRKSITKSKLLIAGAVAGCFAGGVQAATPPVPPPVPTAPVMPAFQMEIVGATLDSPPTFGTGTYSPLRVPPPLPPTIQGGTLQPTVQYLYGPGLLSVVDSLASLNLLTSTTYSLPTQTQNDSESQTTVENPTAGPVTLGLFYADPNLDPINITQTVTIADGSGGYASGAQGYHPNSTSYGSVIPSYPKGALVVGSAGYSWLEISKGGYLNTQGTPNIGTAGYRSPYNHNAGGVFVGTTLSSESSYYLFTSPNGGYQNLPQEGVSWNTLNFGGPATGYGIVNVNGGTWNDSNSPIYVGYGGQGFITVQSAGNVNITNQALILGRNSTGLPTTDTLPASNQSYALPHLPAGIGTMVVKSDGSLTLTGTGGYIALGRSVSSSGATGNLYITGAGSTASVSQGILVGDGGYGYLAVLNGGQVTSGSAYAAGGAKTYGVTTQPGSGNIVIDGVSSSWTISGNADFGVSGVATASVQNNGDLNILGTLTLGDQSTGSGTLTVQADGTAESGDATLGNQAGATGFADVSNINTLWTVDGDLTVGKAGQGTLTLSNNGEVITTGDGILGSQAGSTGSATITDPGTEWQINGELKVGDNGNATMQVENGGFVSLAGNLAIADSGGTSTLTLDGIGSRIIAGGTSVTIGGKGDGTLTVQNAADAVFSGASVSLGENSTGTGTLTVQGSNTMMSTGSLTVGSQGTGTANVQDAASLSTGTNISLGEQSTGSGTLTIDGASVTDAGTLSAGGYGTGTLTIQNGGSLTVQGNDITLGEQSTGSGTLNIVGNGSTLTFNGDLTVGKSGSGTVALSGNASFTGTSMTLASGTGFGGASTGGTGELDISGASSVLLSQDLTIGKYGVGTLAMAGSSVLANKGDATLGSQPGTEGSATLNFGSSWTVGGSFTDGSQGTGTVTVQGGSSLIANGDSLTVGKQGASSLSVTGAKSTVQYAGDLIIGKQADGTFNIADEATTAPTSGGTGKVYIAETSGINGALTINGGGSNLSAADVVIGGTATKAGGNGSVQLTGSGSLSVSQAITLWKNSTLNVTGGYAIIGSAPKTAANGNVYIGGSGELTGAGNITGNMVITAGTVDAGGAASGNLSVAGNYLQTGGTLKFTVAGSGIGQASQLDVTGGVSISGSALEFDFVNGYAPAKGQTFQLIDPPQSVSISGATYSFTGLAPGFTFSVTPDANGLLFTALSNGVATTPIPEPASLGVFALGGLALLLANRRRLRRI